MTAKKQSLLEKGVILHVSLPFVLFMCDVYTNMVRHSLLLLLLFGGVPQSRLCQLVMTVQ